MAKPKVAFYWCASCGGCEEAVVDLAESILDGLRFKEQFHPFGRHQGDILLDERILGLGQDPERDLVRHRRGREEDRRHSQASAGRHVGRGRRDVRDQRQRAGGLLPDDRLRERRTLPLPRRAHTSAGTYLALVKRAHRHTCANIDTGIRADTRTHAHTNDHIHASVHIHADVDADTHPYADIGAYTHTHTGDHAHIHTRPDRDICSSA